MLWSPLLTSWHGGGGTVLLNPETSWLNRAPYITPLWLYLVAFI